MLNYQRGYYQKNRKRLLQYRKDRYRKNKEYHNARIKSSKFRAKLISISKKPKKYFVLIDSKLERGYSLFQMALNMGTSRDKFYVWQKKNIFPECIKKKGTIDLFAESQISLIKKLLECVNDGYIISFDDLKICLQEFWEKIYNERRLLNYVQKNFKKKTGKA